MFSATFYQRRVRGRTYFSICIHTHISSKILDIHTPYMYKYSIPLNLVTHILIHMLTQAITHTHAMLEPQVANSKRRGGGKTVHGTCSSITGTVSPKKDKK